MIRYDQLEYAWIRNKSSNLSVYLALLTGMIISIGNSMVSRGIWDKYRE